MRRRLGGLLEVSWDSFVAPWGASEGASGRPQGAPGAPEASWKPLGAVKKAWWAKEGLQGAYGALLEASWGALGRLLEPSWTVLEASSTPRSCPKEAQKAPKWSSRSVLRRKLLIQRAR